MVKHALVEPQQWFPGTRHRGAIVVDKTIEPRGQFATVGNLGVEAQDLVRVARNEAFVARIQHLLQQRNLVGILLRDDVLDEKTGKLAVRVEHERMLVGTVNLARKQ